MASAFSRSGPTSTPELAVADSNLTTFDLPDHAAARQRIELDRLQQIDSAVGCASNDGLSEWMLASELERRREFGVDLPILNLPSNLPWEMIEMFIRTMAPSGHTIRIL